MVPERCLTLALEMHFHSRAGTKAFRTWGPMTRYSARQVPQCVGSALQFVSPFHPNGVTIRSQGTKAPVKTLEARGRRSPLTTWRMSRIAKGSYCRARCSQKQALAQIAKSGGLRFRSELPAVLASGKAAGGVGGAGAGSPMLALSSPNEASLCATALT
jgi:hypothetical protein